MQIALNAAFHMTSMLKNYFCSGINFPHEFCCMLFLHLKAKVLHDRILL